VTQSGSKGRLDLYRLPKPPANPAFAAELASIFIELSFAGACALRGCRVYAFLSQGWATA
jgi:hypothetical protein